MEPPLISIIIPTFNSANSIEACLLSIIQQTSVPREVLIIDGKSTDDTMEIVKRIASEYNFIKWISESDQGIYDAMNKGVALSRGEWLCFLGSDDSLYDNTVLQNVSDSLVQSQCDLLYGNVILVGDASWGTDSQIYDGEFTMEKLFTKNICHQAVFYKRILFDRLGLYNIEYSVCADWDFNHRCFSSVKTQYLNLVIACFFAGGKSTVNNCDRFTEFDFVLNIKKYYRLSFFNKRFAPFSRVFTNIAYEKIKDQSFKSLYYLFYALYHSNNKFSLMKNYIYSIYRQL